jgi:hypothetical protein
MTQASAVTRVSAYAAVIATLLSSVSIDALAAQGDAPPAAQSETATDAGASAVVEQARDAFRRGAELAKAEHWQEAIAAFEASYQLRAHAVTSYNIGFCEHALHHVTRARKAFKRFLQDQRNDQATRPDELIDRANRYLEELEAALARVDVEVDSPEIALLVDGQSVEKDADSAQAGLPVVVAATSTAGSAQLVPATHFQLIVDPGTHTFTFSYANGKSAVITKTFAPGARAALQQVSPSEPSKPQVAPPTRVSAAPRRTWMYLAFGVGAAGIATGSIAGALALSKKSTLDKECGPTRKACPNRDDVDALKTFADISSVGFVLGAVGVGVGWSLYVWGPGSNVRRATRSGVFQASAPNAGTGGRVAIDIGPNRLSVCGEF